MTDSSFSDMENFSDAESVAAIDNISRSPSPMTVSEAVPSRPKSTRQRKQPAWMKDNVESSDTATMNFSRIALVKCCQTSKVYKVKIIDLSREDGEPMTSQDFKRGSTLFMNLKGKQYPVQFVQFKESLGKENKKSSDKETKTKNKQNSVLKRGTKRDAEDIDQGMPQLRDNANTSKILSKVHSDALDKEPQHKKARMEASTLLDTSDKELIKYLAGKIEKLESVVEDLVRQFRQHPSPSLKVKTEESEDMINGRNAMRLPARDAYAFALVLMDALFTKEELSASLLFKSKKSDKPGLDEGKVSQLLSVVEKRFPDGWDLKTLTAKANQKCRDSKVVVID